MGVDEREAIALGLARGEPVAEIARRLVSFASLWIRDLSGDEG